MRISIYTFLKSLVNTLLVIISFFLVLRVILRLFSTNPATPFVQWIYAISGFLMSPFFAITPDISTQTGVLDMVAIISLLIYLLAGYLLLALIQNFTYSGEDVEEDYPPVVHYHDIDKHKRR